MRAPQRGPRTCMCFDMCLCRTYGLCRPRREPAGLRIKADQSVECRVGLSVERRVDRRVPPPAPPDVGRCPKREHEAGSANTEFIQNYSV